MQVCFHFSFSFLFPKLFYFNVYLANTKEVVSTALDVGYRLVDCAALYQNEKEVGKALAEWYTKSNKERKDVFITSKVWNHCHEKGRVTEACEETLKDLQTDYLDLYLIHWPVSVKYSVKFGAPEKSDFIGIFIFSFPS